MANVIVNNEKYRALFIEKDECFSIHFIINNEIRRHVVSHMKITRDNVIAYPLIE
jgi:hypothetical protein